jgi:hypothetical protein
VTIEQFLSISSICPEVVMDLSISARSDRHLMPWKLRYIAIAPLTASIIAPMYRYLFADAKSLHARPDLTDYVKDLVCVIRFGIYLKV